MTTPKSFEEYVEENATSLISPNIDVSDRWEQLYKAGQQSMQCVIDDLKEKLKDAEEGLTAAYLSGGHSRRDEISALEDRLSRLKKEMEVLDGVFQSATRLPFYCDVKKYNRFMLFVGFSLRRLQDLRKERLDNE